MTDQVLFRVDLDASQGEEHALSFGTAIDLARESVRGLKVDIDALEASVLPLGAMMGTVAQGVDQVRQAARGAAGDLNQMSAAKGTAARSAENLTDKIRTGTTALSGFRNEFREVGYTVLAAAWAMEAFGVKGLGPVTQGGLAVMATTSLVTREMEKGTVAAQSFGGALTRYLVPGLLSVGTLIAGVLLVGESVAQFKKMEKDFEVVGQGAGMTAQQLGALSLAARSAGIDGTNFTRVLSQMAKDIIQVEDGMARGKVPVNDMTKALDAMGISLVDSQGKAKSTFQVVLEMSDAFKSHSDQAKAAGTADESLGRAMALLGERGVELSRVFTNGSAPIKFYLDLLQNLGVGTDEQAERFHSLELAGTSMHATIQASFAAMGSEMAPIITSIERGVQQLVLTISKVDPGFRAAVAGGILFAGVLGTIGVAAAAFIALAGGWALLPIAFVALGAAIGAIKFKALSDDAAAAQRSLEAAGEGGAKSFSRLSEAVREATNVLSEMTKNPSTQELAITAQIDMVKAKMAEMNAEILRTGAGGEEVAKLQKHLDDLVKSGASLDQVTEAQNKLAYAINNNANPAGAAQVATLQKQIDEMESHVKLLTAEKDVYQDQRQALESWIATQKAGQKSIEAIRDALVDWIAKTEALGGSTEAAKAILAGLNQTISNQAADVQTAGSQVGMNFNTGVESQAGEASSKGKLLADSVAEGTDKAKGDLHDSGQRAGATWLNGFGEWLREHFPHIFKGMEAEIPNEPRKGQETAGDRTAEATRNWRTWAMGAHPDWFADTPAGAAALAAQGGAAPPPSSIPTAAGGGRGGPGPVSVVQEPSTKKVKPSALDEFTAARGDVGDLLAEDTYGKLASKAIADLEKGIRLPKDASSGRALFQEIQNLIEKGREANLPDLAQRFNDVADAAQLALAERTPAAAEAARRAIMGLAVDVANAQLGEAMKKQVDTAIEKLQELMGTGRRTMMRNFDPDSFNTQLSNEDEAAFQEWKKRNAPRDSGQDYDLRGAFQAGISPDEESGHWPDTFKKPNHPTFSDQSQFATGDWAKLAGHWEEEIFVPSAEELAGSFWEAWDRIGDQMDDALNNVYMKLRDQQYEQSGKQVADEFVRGFKDEMKNQDLMDKVGEQMSAFVDKAENEIDGLKEKAGDSELNRMKRFGTTYFAGLPSRADIGKEQDYSAPIHGASHDLYSSMGAQQLSIEQQKADAEREKELKKLQLEQEKAKMAQRIKEEEDRIEAAKLVKKLVDEAQAKDRQIQDEIEKAAISEDNANRVAAYKLALEQKLGIDAEGKDRQRVEREIANINRRAAEEDARATQSAERELRRSDQRMQMFFKEQAAKAHTLVGADADEALSRVMESQSSWNAELQQSLDLMKQMRQEAEANVQAYREIKDTTGETVPNFQDMVQWARQAADAVPKPDRNRNAMHLESSSLGAIAPQLQALIQKAYPGGTINEFADKYLHGYSSDVIKSLAGPGQAGHAAAGMDHAARQSQQLHDIMKSIDGRLSKPVGVELTDGSAKKLSDSMRAQPIELILVVNGQQERRHIDRLETRRSVSGQ